uniref:GH16 domain-containing protein n=1 Tax=Alexandrium catenella TaxID=2925 RepID=A0A7S1WF61_ALECA
MADCSNETVELLTGRDAAGPEAERPGRRRSSALRIALAVVVPLALLASVAAVSALASRGPGRETSRPSDGVALSAEYDSYVASGPFKCTGTWAAIAPGQGDANVWRCLGGACVQASCRCDGNFDCMDQSDESGCDSGDGTTQSAVSFGGGGAASRQDGDGAASQDVGGGTFTYAPSPATEPVPVPVPAPAPPAPPGSSSSNSMSFPLASSWQPPPPAEPSSTGSGCYESGGFKYQEVWRAQGYTFFDSFNYLLNDANAGAAQYLTKEDATEKQVTVAYDNHAIIRAGPKAGQMKRASAKLETKTKWTYFFMAAKFNHVPWGCGVWPAFWTHSPEAAWPNGGELDILEYSNEIASRSSFHCGLTNKCKLDAGLMHKPGCPKYIDAEFNFTGDFQCVTHYPAMIGCAPNRLPLRSGEELSMKPFISAVEWTPNYVKLFHIPASEAPSDLEAGEPQPDNYDRWVTSYFPFAASEQKRPGSCPNPGQVMKAQQLVLSLGFCGDWASKVWLNSTCANTQGPRLPEECVAVDPHNPMGEIPAGPRDCCTAFIHDQYDQYGSDEYLSKRAYFNVSWVKVFQHADRRLKGRGGLFA